MKRTLSGVAASLAAVGLAATLGGCSGGGKEYATPGKVCGVPVKEDAFLPLLPDGEKVKEQPADSIESDSGCDIVVDGQVALSVYEEYVSKPYDPMAELESYKFKNRKPIRGLSVAGKGAVGDTNVMITTKCGKPKAEYLLVDVKVDKEAGGDVSQRRKDMQEFAESYVPNAQKKLDCEV
jgi:hypothetical protein